MGLFQPVLLQNNTAAIATGISRHFNLKRKQRSPPSAIRNCNYNAPCGIIMAVNRSMPTAFFLYLTAIQKLWANTCEYWECAKQLFTPGQTFCQTFVICQHDTFDGLLTFFDKQNFKLQKHSLLVTSKQWLSSNVWRRS